MLHATFEINSCCHHALRRSPKILALRSLRRAPICRVFRGPYQPGDPASTSHIVAFHGASSVDLVPASSLTQPTRPGTSTPVPIRVACHWTASLSRAPNLRPHDTPLTSHSLSCAGLLLFTSSNICRAGVLIFRCPRPPFDLSYLRYPLGSLIHARRSLKVIFYLDGVDSTDKLGGSEGHLSTCLLAAPAGPPTSKAGVACFDTGCRIRVGSDVFGPIM